MEWGSTKTLSSCKGSTKTPSSSRGSSPHPRVNTPPLEERIPQFEKCWSKCVVQSLDMDESFLCRRVRECFAMSRFKATRGLLATVLVVLNHGQVTRKAPEMVPLSELLHYTNGRTVRLDV
ncbi:hypothetical protein TNCV_4439801 [Trichonephila clavipes]|nr:hypothetical protein TNCV_4439801 [Trichonephila clavipes]